MSRPSPTEKPYQTDVGEGWEWCITYSGEHPDDAPIQAVRRFMDAEAALEAFADEAPPVRLWRSRVRMTTELFPWHVAAVREAEDTDFDDGEG